MRPLRTGDEAQLSWKRGFVPCRVIAAAGSYVLLRVDGGETVPAGPCSLMCLDGKVPMGFDGDVEPSNHPGELRFRVADGSRVADRRASVRVPVTAPVEVAIPADGREEAAEGSIIDVSAGGMRFRRDGRLTKGTRVRVRAEIPGGPLIDADGIVRLSEPGVCAVEYTELRGSTAQDIGAWTVGVLRHALVAA